MKKLSNESWISCKKIGLPTLHIHLKIILELHIEVKNLSSDKA